MLFIIFVDKHRFVRRLEELLDVDELDEMLHHQQHTQTATDSRTISGISEDERPTGHSQL